MELTGTTTLDKSGPGSNGNEETLCGSPELEPHHQMQFNVILRTYIFFAEGRVLALSRGFS